MPIVVAPKFRDTATCCLLAIALVGTLSRPLQSQERVVREIATRPADPAALRKEIDALNDAMVAAFKQNPASVAGFYTDDARIIGGGGNYQGRQQIDSYWAQATMFTDWSLEVLDSGGDWASPWLLGRSTLKGQSGRGMVVNYLGVLRRMPDGSLKYQVDFYTAAPGGAGRQP